MSSLIHIPKPCSENWNAMKSVDGSKRYCELCRNNVHDFTNASFAEIDQKTTEAKGEILCGNYHERHTTTSKKVYVFINALEQKLLKRNWKKISLICVIVLLFLSGCVKRYTKGRKITGGGDSQSTSKTK